VVLRDLDSPDPSSILTKLESGRESQLAHSRLYVTLDDLHNKGFVEVVSNTGRVTRYRLTSKGREWIR
jgi:DNA-binding PadR family transcriptional regulator